MCTFQLAGCRRYPGEGVFYVVSVAQVSDSVPDVREMIRYDRFDGFGFLLGDGFSVFEAWFLVIQSVTPSSVVMFACR